MSTVSAHLWRRVQTGGRAPFLVYVECRARELNETNRLRRGGWQESTTIPRRHCCPEFSEVSA